ncbi:unnamed protein product [Calicophoron daubneyi]|uniref:Uncharacterized protein n=1 Tax=Calicophoron daubneyi TaxID=300641 RepID=A0AAV2THM4_CALDB
MSFEATAINADTPDASFTERPSNKKSNTSDSVGKSKGEAKLTCMEVIGCVDTAKLGVEDLPKSETEDLLEIPSDEGIVAQTFNHAELSVSEAKGTLEKMQVCEDVPGISLQGNPLKSEKLGETNDGVLPGTEQRSNFGTSGNISDSKGVANKEPTDGVNASVGDLEPASSIQGNTMDIEQSAVSPNFQAGDKTCQPLVICVSGNDDSSLDSSTLASASTRSEPQEVQLIPKDDTIEFSSVRAPNTRPNPSQKEQNHSTVLENESQQRPRRSGRLKGSLSVSIVDDKASSDASGADPSYEKANLDEDPENECRRSLRKRRRSAKAQAAVQDEYELDELLSDKVTLKPYGPAKNWSTGEYLTDDWVSVEKIIANRKLDPRKLVKSVSESIDSYAPAQKRMVEREYFVKFHDQSYWYCAWMSGAILSTMHPGLLRHYFRQLPSSNGESPLKTVHSEDNSVDPEAIETVESVDSANKGQEEKQGDPVQMVSTSSASKTNTVELPAPSPSETVASDVTPTSIPIIVSHNSEEETDREDDCNAWENDTCDDISHWVTPKSECMGARRRYLLKWGVESYTLVPARVLSVGEPFVPDSFEDSSRRLKGRKGGRCRKTNLIRYREVLVMWLHMPYNQATWETVEADMDNLERAVNLSRTSQRPVLRPLDPCGRRLLPFMVRKQIIRLMEKYLSRIAVMLCDAYGNQAVLKRGYLRSLENDSWKQKWMGEQPTYLSPVHHSTLHPYQMEGVRWLWHAYHNRVNAVLADEMGLGKTVQVIALLYSLWKEDKDYGPFLIAAPLSTLLNWEREFEVWAPELHVIVYTGDKNTRSVIQDYEFHIPNFGELAAFHVLITSHELACIDRPVLQQFEWSVLVVDEAHRLKNKQSRLFKETSQYRAGFKMLLTGTPLQNNLEELFHLLNFVEPKTFADFKELSKEWAVMPKEQRIVHLHDQLKHHLLRRMKADVVRDLPKKTEIMVMVDMTILQRRLYKLILTKNYEELRCGSLMNSLVHLQKVCDHPYLMPAGEAIAPRVDPDNEDSAYEPKALVQVSGKMVVLMDLLEGLRTGGHRVLIYSRMTTMLDILEEVLINVNWSYERIDGRVRGPMRQIAIDRFNSPNAEAFIFLLTTRAGGEGINLASADTVVLYDSDWNPHCDLQALSRAHRIGQSRHVVIYRFVTRHSMEERVTRVARRKLALTHLVVDQQQQREQERRLAKEQKLAREQQEQQQSDGISAQTTEEHSEGEEPNSVVTKSTESDKKDSGSGLKVSKSISTGDLNDLAKTTAPNRLSRTEMDELLRAGVEALFAVDDPLDQDNLFSAARTTDLPDDSERIVYDAQAIARLLDRSHLEADQEDDVNSAAEEYLSTFRVAHFDTMVTEPQPTEPPKKDGHQDGETTSDSNQEQAHTEQPVDAVGAENAGTEDQPVEEIGFADFWDRLLRERHARLVSAELEAVNKMSRRTYRSSYRFANDVDFDTSSHLDDDEEEQQDQNKEEITESISGGEEDTATGKQMRPVSLRAHRRRSKRGGFRRGRPRLAGRRVEGRRRSPRPAVDEQGDADDGNVSTSSSTLPRRRRRKKFGPIDDDPKDADYRPEADSSEDNPNSSDDPELVIEPEVQELNPIDIDGWRLRNLRAAVTRPGRVKDSGTTSKQLEDGVSSDQNPNDPALGYVTDAWYPEPSVCEAWWKEVKKLGPMVRRIRGELFIYDFGPADRQLFANSVMRYGLPPPGIVPPQEWLPPSLYFKHPLNVFAYTELFMRHLYEDPNGMDELEENWSDGLPKEELSVPAILSRVAMMALIRRKILQFEDVNGVHSKSYEALSTHFRFSIHEGGLTLLRQTWSVEWKRINNLTDKIPETHTPTQRHQAAIRYLQYTWHSRHDYWLLAAIHVHGYFQWGEILSDPRFALLSKGLDGLLEDKKKKQGASTNERHNQNLQSHFDSIESQAFLLNRLRLLEQALLVEEALRQVARAALAGNSAVGEEPPPSRVENLAACLSNKLAAAGVRKRIALPRDPRAREATRTAVIALQNLLEDIYADLPGLPATVIAAEPEVHSRTGPATEVSSATATAPVVSTATSSSSSTTTNITDSLNAVAPPSNVVPNSLSGDTAVCSSSSSVSDGSEEVVICDSPDANTIDISASLDTTLTGTNASSSATTATENVLTPKVNTSPMSVDDSTVRIACSKRTRTSTPDSVPVIEISDEESEKEDV